MIFAISGVIMTTNIDLGSMFRDYKVEEGTVPNDLHGGDIVFLIVRRHKSQARWLESLACLSDALCSCAYLTLSLSLSLSLYPPQSDLVHLCDCNSISFDIFPLRSRHHRAPQPQMATLLPLHRIRHGGAYRGVPRGARSSRHCVAPPAPGPQALQISLGARIRYDVASRSRHFVGRPPRRGGIVSRNDGLARVRQRVRNRELSCSPWTEVYVPHVRHRFPYTRPERINRRRAGPRTRSCHRTA